FSFLCRYSFLFLIPRPPSVTLFPYTTLFRSCLAWLGSLGLGGRGPAVAGTPHPKPASQPSQQHTHQCIRVCLFVVVSHIYIIYRSEEHTSELQSRENLVCRLLLEKKKSSAHT